MEELRSAVRNQRKILILRLYDFVMPNPWPPGTDDIRDVVMNSPTITYMAEFFIECVEKIKLFLGPCNNFIYYFNLKKTKKQNILIIS